MKIILNVVNASLLTLDPLEIALQIAKQSEKALQHTYISASFYHVIYNLQSYLIDK
jgi:hypothetical protein